MQRIEKRGWTLVELLIVIAIIAVMLQLTLPAVEMSRESARKAQCKNNLKQIALAFQNHEATHGHLPTSGWGRRWLGHPDRGYGLKQPGGWAYNILPFIEQQHVRDLGTGLAPHTEEIAESLLQANSTAISMFNCPSRRMATLFPFVDQFVPNSIPRRCGKDPFDCKVARSDYAANAGNIHHWVHRATGPGTIEAGDGEWEEKWIYGGPDGKSELTGISYQRSQIRLSEITDGLSHTYCVGEKYVPIPHYKTGEWFSDNATMFLGHDYDNNRWSGTNEGEDIPPPFRDSESEGHKVSFGSAHLDGFQMSFCDGSVRIIPYDGDLTVHRMHGGRNDHERALD